MSVSLKPSDSPAILVDTVVAFESLTIKEEVDRLGTGVVINVSDVTLTILKSVMNYCRKHVEEPKDFDELKIWDANFITLHQHVIFDLMLAARYLKIQGLQALASEHIKYMVEGKTSDEILAKLFNITPNPPI